MPSSYFPGPLVSHLCLNNTGLRNKTCSLLVLVFVMVSRITDRYDEHLLVHNRISQKV